MLYPTKKPCCICRRWFRPDGRIGSRQHACSRRECQAARRKKTQARWRARNPGYFIANRIQARNEAGSRPRPPTLLHPLSDLPWDIARYEFGAKGADFIGVMGSLLLQAAKDQFRAQIVDSTGDAGPLP